MMRAAMEKGQWVFFQNCHLSPSWMPTLERLVEQIDPDHVCLKYLYLNNN
jgi:dynein heavy chain